MEGWGKIGVQSASVLYPNSCYNESCYIEVQVYYTCSFCKNYNIDKKFSHLQILLKVSAVREKGLSFHHCSSWIRKQTVLL